MTLGEIDEKSLLSPSFQMKVESNKTYNVELRALWSCPAGRGSSGGDTTTMLLGDYPYWVERMLTIGLFDCAESAHVSFRQESLRRLVLEAVNSYDNGREQLRQACLEELHNSDDKIVIHALSGLFVIGKPSDASAVKPLTQHLNPSVQKNARVCSFELCHRDSEE